MLFRVLIFICLFVPVLLSLGTSTSAADDSLSSDEFLKIYRTAVGKQIGQIVDFEIDTIESIPRRGDYHRTIFVRAPRGKDTQFASRGDILVSQDSEPSQDIFTRVHFCHAGKVTVLLKRSSETNPFEIYVNETESGKSIRHNIADNIDALAYASFAWFGQRWLDYLEVPGAITGIEQKNEDGVELVDVSFKIPKNVLVAGQSPNFHEGIVTFDPKQDWVLRRIRTPDGGVAAGHDPTQRIFYDGSINEYEKHAGMWLPKSMNLRFTTKDKEGKIVRDAIQSATVESVRIGPVSDARFDLKTYGLGSIANREKGPGLLTVLIINALVIGTILLLVVLRKFKSKPLEKIQSSDEAG